MHSVMMNPFTPQNLCLLSLLPWQLFPAPGHIPLRTDKLLPCVRLYSPAVCNSNIKECCTSDFVFWHFLLGWNFSLCYSSRYWKDDWCRMSEWVMLFGRHWQSAVRKGEWVHLSIGQSSQQGETCVADSPHKGKSTCLHSSHCCKMPCILWSVPTD